MNATSLNSRHLSGDVWGGFAAMLVALPSAIAFGVTIFAPLGAEFSAQGAVAGILGVVLLGLVAALLGGTQRLISAPCAPAAAVLSALTIQMSQQGAMPASILLTLFLVALISSGVQILFGALRIGQLIRYMPFPVVSGFSLASASSSSLASFQSYWVLAKVWTGFMRSARRLYGSPCASLLA